MGWFGPSKKKTLWKAAKDGNEAELRRLIELGGNVNWHNPEEYGSTALMAASQFGHEGCVRLLIESGATVNATDSIGGDSALHHAAWHHAAWNGHLAIAKRLLEGGADATLRDNRGRTAIDCARERGHSEVVALLSEPRYADGDRTECESNVELNANRMRNRLRTE